MRKGSGLLTTIGVVLLVAGLVIGAVFGTIDKISSIISISATMIGLLAIFWQFLLASEVSQASFIVSFNKQFYKHERNRKMLKYFDHKHSHPEKARALTEADAKDFLSYLAWIRILCSLVLRGVLTFDSMNEVFRYKFFVCVNNVDIQRIEITKYAEFYDGLFRTYKDWSAYLNRHGQTELYSETALSKTEAYQRYLKEKNEYLNENRAFNENRFSTKKMRRKKADK